MPKFSGNTNIELYFTVEAEDRDQALDFFYEALKRLNGEHFTQESYDIGYFGMKEQA